MKTFITISLIIHVTAGALALLSGSAAILFRNHVKKHRPFGKVYFWCMTVVFVTAVYVSLFHNNLFLFCVAFFSYYSCLTAFRSLKLKKLHAGQKPQVFDWAVEALFGFVHIGFVSYGIYLMLHDTIEIGIICLAFGTLGLRGNWINTKRLRGNVDHPNHWLITHIGGMLGSYIGAVTAFLVNNNNRWIHMPQIIAWLGPAFLLVPLIVYEVNRFKRKVSPVERS